MVGGMVKNHQNMWIVRSPETSTNNKQDIAVTGINFWFLGHQNFTVRDSIHGARVKENVAITYLLPE